MATTLGIDLGTGSVKAALVDGSGRVVASARRTYPLSTPHPGWVEADPATWLAATREAVAEVCAGRPAPDAVGFSGQMHGVVLTAADGSAVRPAVLWADGRATEQADALGRALGPATLARLGSPAVPGFAATTLAWLAAHEPAHVRAAQVALQPKDWLRQALGGHVVTDPSDAAGTLLYDVVSGERSADAVAWLGPTGGLLPPIVASDAAAGTVHLPCGAVPCVVGAADTACVVTGLGLHPGDAAVAVGTGAQVVAVLDTPTTDPTLRTHTFATAGPPRAGWYRLGAVQNAGLALDVALSWLDATTDELAAALTGGVRDDDPLFVPYLAGERTPFLDPGLRGSWLGLGLSTDRAALLRSVAEGVAHAVALAVDAVAGAGAAVPPTAALVGGGVHADAVRQLLADATGLRLAVTPTTDAAVVGAAVLARGLRANPAPLPVLAVVEPDPQAAARLAGRRSRMVSQVTEGRRR